MKILFLYNRFENLGIEVLSSFLKSAGYRVELLFYPQLFNDGYMNMPYLANKFDYHEKILKQIEKIKPDLVAFSILTDNYTWALNLASEIKKKYSPLILFGGVHCTSVPEEVISHEFIDFVIIGEGEYALLDLVKSLEKNKDYSKIENLIFKKGKKIVKNNVRNLIKNLDTLPFPDKDLFYKVIPYSKKTYTIMTSRGCPYSCTYCFNNIYRKVYYNKGKYLRKRSVDNVISELKVMKKRNNYEFVSILDDVFMTNDKWLEEFTIKYKKEINIPFRCIGHVNCINKNNIRMLKNAGCEIVQIGIQTTCENTRKNIIHRYETNEIIKKTSRIIKENGIKLEVDHIFGFPFEGEKEQIEAAKFYNEIRPDIINTYWLKCFPKTDIIKEMIKDNKLSKKDISRIEKGMSPSYVLGGDVKNKKDLQRFSSLFNIIPLLPKSFVMFIINKRLYYLINFGSKFMMLSRLIKSLVWRDIRLFEFISFYRYYLFKKFL